jgi:chromate transporter
LGVSAIWLALWLIPVIGLLLTLGSANVFSQIAVFFSKMAVVTFGGAYAVLAYVAQQAVEHYGCSSRARCSTAWAWRRRRRAR